MKSLIDAVVEGTRRKRLIDGSYVVSEDEWDALRDLAYVALTLVPDIEVCPACSAIALVPGDGELLPEDWCMCLSCSYTVGANTIGEA